MKNAQHSQPYKEHITARGALFRLFLAFVLAVTLIPASPLQALGTEGATDVAALSEQASDTAQATDAAGEATSETEGADASASQGQPEGGDSATTEGLDAASSDSATDTEDAGSAAGTDSAGNTATGTEGSNSNATTETTEDGATNATEGDGVVIEEEAASLTLLELLEKAATSSSQASKINATVLVGESEQTATFVGGALVDELQLQATFTALQKAQAAEAASEESTEDAAEATATSEQITNFVTASKEVITGNTNFAPRLTFTSNQVPTTMLTAVRDGMYTGAAVRNADGQLTAVVAAATVENQSYYANTEGEVKALAEEEELVVAFAEPEATVNNQASALNTLAAVDSLSIDYPEFESITAADGIIRVEEADTIIADKFLDFDYDVTTGGTIDSTTAPTAADAGLSSGMYFSAAYVLVGGEGGARYQIDWLAKDVDGIVYYRLQNNAAASGPVVLTSALGANDWILFSYDTDGNQKSYQIETKTSIESLGVQQSFPDEKPEWKIVPNSVTGEFIVQAERIPGSVLYLKIEGGSANTGYVAALPDQGLTGVGSVYQGTSVDDSTTVQWRVTPNTNNDTIYLTLVSGGVDALHHMSVSVTQTTDTALGGGGYVGIYNGAGNTGSVSYFDHSESLSSAHQYVSAGSSAVFQLPSATSTYWWERQGGVENNWFTITRLWCTIGVPNQSFQHPENMYLKYTDMQTGEEKTVHMPFPSPMPRGTQDAWTSATFTQGDLKGTKVTVTRNTSDDYQIQGVNVGSALYDISLENLRVDVDIYIDYYNITYDQVANTRIVAGDITGVDLAASSVTPVNPATTINTPVLKPGQAYRFTTGTFADQTAVTVDFKLADDYYDPVVYVSNNSGTQILPTTSKGNGEYSVEITPELGKTTTFFISATMNTYSVSKELGNTTSWTWPGGEPFYGSLMMSRSNDQLVVSSSIPLGHTGQNGTGSTLYFDGWKVAGDTSGNTFEPGDVIDIFNDIQLPDGTFHISLVAQWKDKPDTNDPVPVTYDIERRNSTGGYDPVSMNTVLAQGQEFALAAANELQEGTDIWRIASVEGETSGTFNAVADGSTPATVLPTFTYEHVQTFTFGSGGTNPGGGAVTTVTTPASSEGISFNEEVTLTPAGVGTASVENAYTTDGYHQTGWLNTTTNEQYLFDTDANRDGILDSVTVARPYASTELVPVWELDAPTMSAADFSMSLEEVTSFGFTTESGTVNPGREQEFKALVDQRSLARALYPTPGYSYDWEIDYSAVRAAVGFYEVTFTLYETEDATGTRQPVSGPEGVATVQMAVTTDGSTGTGDSSLFAFDFTVGLDYLEASGVVDARGNVVDQAALDQAIWDLSKAMGTRDDGTMLQLGDVDITVAGSAAPTTLAPGSYAINFTDVNSWGLSTDVTMTVYDHMTIGDNYIVVSNDFQAGEDELIQNGEKPLSTTAAIARAQAKVYAANNPAVALDSSELSVDLSNAWGGTAKNSPITNGAIFAAHNDTANPQASSTSAILVTASGAGSEDGSYRINAQDFSYARSLLTGDASAIASALYTAAQVTGVSNSAALSADGYGTTWTVAVEGVDITTGNPTWPLDSYEVTFTLLNTGTETYSATVTMTLYDSGQVSGDGTRAIFSNNFSMRADERDTLLTDTGTSADNYTELQQRAGVVSYTIDSNGYYIADTGYNNVTVALQNDMYNAAVAGAKGIGPAVFTLTDGSNLASRSYADVFTSGGVTEGVGEIWATNFFVQKSELGTSTPTPSTITSELAQTLFAKAQGVAVDAIGADVSDTVTVTAVTPANAAWVTGTTYNVTFQATGSTPAGGGSNTMTVMVQMTVHDNTSGAGENYTVASNDFRVLESEVDALIGNAGQLRTLGGAAVYTNSGTPQPTLVSQLVVDDSNLVNKKAGQDASVSFTLPASIDADTPSAVSDVTIYRAGAEDPNPDSQAELWAQDIYASKAEVAGAANLNDFLYERAGVYALNPDGSVAGSDVVTAKVNGADVTSANVVNGATITFELADPANAGSALLSIDVTAHITDDGDTVTDPEGGEGNTPVTYGVFSSNFRASLEEIMAEDPTGSLLDPANNYSALQTRAQAVITKQQEGEAAIPQDGTEANLSIDLDALAAMVNPGTAEVVFTNIMGGADYSVSSTSIATVFHSGGTVVDPGDPDDPNDDTYTYLYANNFSTTYDAITAASDIKEFLFDGAGTELGTQAGPGNVDDATVYVKNSAGAYVDLDTYLASADFNNWLSPTYDLQFSYSGIDAFVTMTISEKGGSSADGSVNLWASSFTTSTVLLGKVTEDNYASYLWNEAKANGTINNIPATAADATIYINGMALNSATWPTTEGEYALTFELVNPEDPTQTATADVTMTVLDRSSEDGTDPNPGGGSGGEEGGDGGDGGSGGEEGGNTDPGVDPDDPNQPVAGDNYIIYASDFMISLDERDSGALIEDELISRGKVVSYHKDNRYTPAGTVYVPDAGFTALAGAVAGKAFNMPFKVQEDANAQAVSVVTVKSSGSTVIDPNDPNYGTYLYADDFVTTKSLIEQASDLQQFFFDAAAVQAGTLTGAATADDVTVEVYVGGAWAPVASLVGNASFDNWASSSYEVRYSYEGLTAQVTMTVRDNSSGDGSGSGDDNPNLPQPDPNDPNQPVEGINYVIFSDNFFASIEERNNGVLTEAELIKRGNAIAYLKNNLTYPSGTVFVPEAGFTALNAALAGTAFNLPYQIREEAGTQAVSVVRMMDGGSMDWAEDGTLRAALYANNFQVALDENPQNWTYDQLINEIFIRSGAVGMLNEAALASGANPLARAAVAAGLRDVTAADLEYTVDGMLLTADNFHLIDWWVGGHQVSLKIAGTNAIANVIMDVLAATPTSTGLAKTSDSINLVPFVALLMAALGLMLLAWRRRREEAEANAVQATMDARSNGRFNGDSVRAQGNRASGLMRKR